MHTIGTVLATLPVGLFKALQRRSFEILVALDAALIELYCVAPDSVMITIAAFFMLFIMRHFETFVGLSPKTKERTPGNESKRPVGRFDALEGSAG